MQFMVPSFLHARAFAGAAGALTRYGIGLAVGVRTFPWATFGINLTGSFLLGFILDFIEIIFVVVPIVGPVLMAMGLDPIWLGVMMAVNLQTSSSPPFGFSCLPARCLPGDTENSALISGSIHCHQLFMLLVLALFPQLPRLRVIYQG
jgi:TRAP-type mannitol/chloroaromatic compound transport system permease large subunit